MTAHSDAICLQQNALIRIDIDSNKTTSGIATDQSIDEIDIFIAFKNIEAIAGETFWVK